MTYTEEEHYYCPDCSDNWRCCDKCGECYDVDELEYDEENDELYCKDCYEEILADREEEVEDE